MSFKRLKVILLYLVILTLPAWAGSSADYNQQGGDFAVGSAHLQSTSYESFQNQVHYYGALVSSNLYQAETGAAQTDSANPLKISDPYIIIRSLSNDGSEVNYSQRLLTRISKNTQRVSASITVDHNLIPVATFDAFNGVDVQIHAGPSGNTEVSVTGDLKNYLDSNFPNKYITVTIADAGSSQFKIIYVRNDAGQRIRLTDLNGQILSGLAEADVGRISNVVTVPGGYSFRVYKFSDYGLVTLNSIVWNQASVVTGNAGTQRQISVQVLDSQSQAVSGAPVIFHKLAGNGSLSALVATTNVSGNAFTTFTFSTGIEENIVSASVDLLTTSPNLVLQTVDQPILIVSEYQILNKIAPVSGGYTGNSDDLVPGSKIVYSLRVINTGNGTANAVVVRENIPLHTTFFEVPAGSDVVEIGQSLGQVTDVDYKVSGVYQANPPSNLSTVQGLRFNVPPIAPSGNVLLRYTVTVN